MAENVEDRFNKACDHLPGLVKKLDSSQLLRFYALYKQASIGPCNIEKPSWYNIEAKSKYNAWKSLEEMSKFEAMNKYIELLCEVSPGWEDKEDEEIDWGESEDTGSKKESQSQTKGWVNVSSMVNDESQLGDEEKNIFEWAKEGNLSMLTNLIPKLKSFDVNELDENGLNCLHWACDRGHLDVVQYLVEKCGADVNCTDADGDTGLDYATAIEDTGLIEYLKKAG